MLTHLSHHSICQQNLCSIELGHSLRAEHELGALIRQSSPRCRKQAHLQQVAGPSICLADSAAAQNHTRGAEQKLALRTSDLPCAKRKRETDCSALAASSSRPARQSCRGFCNQPPPRRPARAVTTTIQTLTSMATHHCATALRRSFPKAPGLSTQDMKSYTQI